MSTKKRIRIGDIRRDTDGRNFKKYKHSWKRLCDILGCQNLAKRGIRDKKGAKGFNKQFCNHHGKHLPLIYCNCHEMGCIREATFEQEGKKMFCKHHAIERGLLKQVHLPYAKRRRIYDKDDDLEKESRTDVTAPKQVYLIHCQNTEYFKVGVSNHPLKRAAKLQTGNPEKLKLINSFVTPQAYEIESKIHNYLKEEGCHKRNEWFLLSGSKVVEVLTMMGSVD